jgi:hypothetical protein
VNKPLPSLSTLAAQQLEAKRRERAFSEISTSWWWFTEAERRAHEENPVAWQWEFLRRSSAYGDFYAKARAGTMRASGESVCSPADRLVKHAITFPLRRELAASYSRLGDSDPCHNWAELFTAGCVPNLYWTALRDQARVMIANAAPLFARADHAETLGGPFELVRNICPVVVRRLPSGGEELISPKEGLNNAILGRFVGKHDPAGILPAVLPAGTDFGTYVAVVFDARFTERILSEMKRGGRLAQRITPLLAELLCLLTTWRAGQTGLPRFAAHKSLGCVLPSNSADECHAWISVDSATTEGEVVARFRTLIRAPYKRGWLPNCDKVWRALDPTYAADSLALAKTKPACIKSLEDRKVGLCACDCRRIESRFTRKGLLANFLRNRPGFESYVGDEGSELLQNAHQKASRLIHDIDEFYHVPPGS